MVKTRGRGERDPDGALRRYLEEVVVGRFGYSAVVARVSDAKGVLAQASAVGDGEPAVGPESSFDLASLTKSFVATLASALDREGRLPLVSRIGDHLPGAHQALARRSLDELLRHRSGLLPWAPLYAAASAWRRVPAGEERLDELARDPRWWGARRGTYSDLGYMVYGRVAIAATGRSLAELFAERRLGVTVQPGDRPGVVRSRLDTGREADLAARLGIRIPTLGPPSPGRAQDGNARTIGSLPGHAGLFGSVEAVARLGQLWLEHAARSRGAEARSESQALVGSGTHLRGWRRATRRGSAGPALGVRAFGHDGFTGGSLWVDPESRLVMVLLGHRRDEFLDLRPMRRGFHRWAMRLARVDGARR